MPNPKGNPNWKKGVSANPAGRPTGADRYTKFKDFIFATFHENEEEVRQTIKNMCSKKDELMTLLRYLYDLSPKESVSVAQGEDGLNWLKQIENLREKEKAIDPVVRKGSLQVY